jgi:hypothetical protein
VVSVAVSLLVATPAPALTLDVNGLGSSLCPTYRFDDVQVGDFLAGEAFGDMIEERLPGNGSLAACTTEPCRVSSARAGNS